MNSPHTDLGVSSRFGEATARLLKTHPTETECQDAEGLGRFSTMRPAGCAGVFGGDDRGVGLRVLSTRWRLTAFDGRCIPGCVAPRSKTPGILGRPTPTC